MPVSQAGAVDLAAEIVRRLASWREAGRKRHVGSPEIRVVDLSLSPSARRCLLASCARSP